MAEAHLVPHRNHVVLEHDEWEPGWFLHHCRSGERVRLAEPPESDQAWQLVFDEEGFGTVTSENCQEEEELSVDDRLQWGLYEDGKGQQLIVHEDGTQVKLWEACLQHDLYKVSLSVGSTHREVEVIVGVFDRHVLMCQVQWSLPSLHGALGFRRFDVPNDWIYGRWGSWQKAFANRHIPGVLLRSRPYAGSRMDSEAHAAQQDDYPHLRVLPFPSVDSIGLVGTLANAALCLVQRGGLRSPACVAASLEVLQGVLGLLAGKCWFMDIVMLRSVEFRYPARPVCQGCAVRILVDHHGKVDLHGLKIAAVGLPPKAKLMIDGLGIDWLPEEPIIYWLRRLVKNHDMLFVQSITQIGLQLDKRITTKLRAMIDKTLEALGEGWHTVKISTEGLTLADGSDAIKERRLLEYHAAGLHLTKGVRQLAIVVDKSRVFGKATWSGACFLRDNTAFWMAPKVVGENWLCLLGFCSGVSLPHLNFRLGLSEFQIGPF
jgi:hypothetical protein